jgi:hypothetical protein
MLTDTTHTFHFKKSKHLQDEIYSYLYTQTIELYN